MATRRKSKMATRRKSNGQFVKGGGRRMARRSSSRTARPRRRGGMTLPVMLLAGFAPLVGNALGEIRTSGVAQGLRNTVKYIAPFDPATGKWTTAYLGGGLLPLIIVGVVHRFIAPMVNRKLAAARVPLL